MRLTLRQLKAMERKLYGGRSEWRPYATVSDDDLLTAHTAMRSGQPVPPDIEARMNAAMAESLRGVPVSPALSRLTDAELARAFEQLRPSHSHLDPESPL
jgi:hypothetical protein